MSFRVHTAPDAPDPRLRGRRYGIPFEGVWQAARRVVSGGRGGWVLTWEDDVEGVIEAHTPPRFLRSEGVVRVRVFLDADGQTEVQLSSGPVGGRRERSASRRRIVTFLADLDRELAAPPLGAR